MGFLTEGERIRYHRQMILSGWGEAGQGRLKGATVFIAGAGGLGSPAALYLAAAGVGRLRVCDGDTVELSNLNRQVLHGEDRIGMNKARSAKRTLSEINPDIEIEPLEESITGASAERLLGESDLIVDCLDNFPTRYLLSDLSVRKGIPFLYGSVWGLCGYLSLFHPPETPCLRCIFPHPPAPEVFPVVGVTPGVIGCLQALQAVRFLLGEEVPAKGFLHIWDGERLDLERVRVRRDPACPVCAPFSRSKKD